MAFGNVNTGAYQHPRYKECEHDMYRFNVDDTGHIVNAKPITGQDISWLGIEAEKLLANEIKPQTNLDDLTDPGIYYCPDDENVFMTLMNNPSNRAFDLIVGKNLQIWVGAGYMWTRQAKGNSYTGQSWVTVYTEKDPPPTITEERFYLNYVDTSYLKSYKAVKQGSVVTITMELELPNVGEPGNFSLCQVPENMLPKDTTPKHIYSYVPFMGGYAAAGRGVISINLDPGSVANGQMTIDGYLQFDHFNKIVTTITYAI